MQTLYFNRTTRLVTSLPFGRVPAQVQSVRGHETINLIVVDGTPAAPILPDAGLNAGIVIRPPANLKQGCLAGPTILTRGASAAAGYTGTTSTDTTLTRTLMHVNDNDPATEVASFTASAVVYLVPAGGGDALESLPFTWSINANYYRPLQPAADIIQTYPSAAAVAAAVGQAGDVMVIQCPDSIGGDFSVDGARGTAVITDRSGNQEIAFIFGAATLTALQLTAAGVLRLPPLPPGLLIVDLSFNALDQAAMAAIVNQLHAAGLTGGYLNLYSQSSGETLDAPALANLAIMTNSRSWSVVL